jgi:L-alanine-DL-glutamate epimerase-like enolase superfamily enzyme
MNITKYRCNYEREPLSAPFGFKGGYLSELWQTIAKFEDADGNIGLGLGLQSVLWSDGDVFGRFPETMGNSIMFLTTAFAMEMAKDVKWATPIELLDNILPQVYERSKLVADTPDLRLTFALNAMVATDNAAWLLYAQSQGISSFDELVPEAYRSGLSVKHDKLVNIPLITYNVTPEAIGKIANDGFCFLKIKVGSDPDKDGDRAKMVEWDKQRLAEIHNIVKDVKTPYTDSGYIAYYLDANGRYDSKERLMELLDYADEIGALERILILEEPFPEEMKIDVSDIPARVAADESAHSDKDALERIELGYSAIALKPIAKTVSMSLKIAKLAVERNIPCFCADLTVNPIMVDWNKNFAARLPVLPGMKIGVVESNGAQNYKNWDAMTSYHPCAGAPWISSKAGIYELDEDFYNQSGGIFQISEHYKSLID